MTQPSAPTTQPELSPDQSEALSRIHAWLDKDVNTDPEFKLGGFAGTGKTTLIRRLLDDLRYDALSRKHDEGENVEPPKVAIISFTGKAVSVLRRKGLSAYTIHSSIYTATKDSKGEVTWSKKPRFENEDVSDPDLIIVDEASMPNRQLIEDLRSYKKKILWVGDPGQLEPVGDDVGLMKNPDYTLTQVHRQALENPILKLSLDVRDGVPFINQRIGANSELHCCSIFEAKMGHSIFLNADIIIVGYNKERKVINRDVRQLRGFKGETPQPGEKIIILQNCPQYDVFNGQIVTVEKIHRRETVAINYKKYETEYVETVDDLGTRRSFPLFIEPFSMITKWDEEKKPCPRPIVYADFGYCITCHKSQGSEWDNVLVLEPSWWGSEKAGFLWDKKRWRYTAITRAAKRLVYARP